MAAIRSDLKFACCRCGVVYTVATVADGPAAARSLLAIGRYELRPGEELSRTVEHDCGDGEFGVARFIGRDATPAG